MDQKYLTIKLALSKVGENRYRSRIERSPLGASKGSGFDFELTQNDWDAINDFIKKMPGVDLRAIDVKTMGNKLYSLAFGSEVGGKYKECLTLTKSGRRSPRIRLAISVVNEDLLRIPWEYLHDGNEFLLRQNHTIIRVIDELTEGRAPYCPIKRLLIAIANPGSQDPKNSDFTPFDADQHKTELEKRLESFAGFTSEILMPATRVELESKIRDGNFDALYFLGHGTFSDPQEGQLILETEENKDDPLDPGELSSWLSNTSGGQSIRFVYLNSCATSQTDPENVFAGVAQRLMLGGDIDAAVAMQTKVQQKAALEVALAFFDEMLRGSVPEQALALARFKARDHHSWGIPVIFSSIAGPEELERNRIAALLSADSESSFAFVLGNFRMGVPVVTAGDKEYTLSPVVSYCYPGETFSVRDTRSAFDVLRLVSQIADPSRIHLRTATDLEEGPQCTHWFLFGSKSNSKVAYMLKNYSTSFQFDYDPLDNPGCWMLKDLEMEIDYLLQSPNTSKRGEYDTSEDFGIIEKVVDDGKVFFLVAGLGDRATRGCGWYLYEKWKELFDEFGNKSFRIILRFPAGLEFKDAKRISRQSALLFTSHATAGDDDT